MPPVIRRVVALLPLLAHASLLLPLLAHASQASLLVDFYHASDCSGSPNATIDISVANESRCTQCWDRCAANTGYSAFKLRGAGRVAINGNCVGEFAYVGLAIGKS